MGILFISKFGIHYNTIIAIPRRYQQNSCPKPNSSEQTSWYWQKNACEMVSISERRELSIKVTQKESNCEIKGPTAVSFFNVFCLELELKDTLIPFTHGEWSTDCSIWLKGLVHAWQTGELIKKRKMVPKRNIHNTTSWPKRVSTSSCANKRERE